MTVYNWVKDIPMVEEETTGYYTFSNGINFEQYFATTHSSALRIMRDCGKLLMQKSAGPIELVSFIKSSDYEKLTLAARYVSNRVYSGIRAAN